MKLFLDFETFLVQPACQAPPIVCAVLAEDDGPAELLHARFDPLYARLEGYLRDPDVEIVAHSASFEVLVMMAAHPEWTSLLFQKLRGKKIRCTEVREKLIRIGRGERFELFNLEACLGYWKLPVTVDKSSYWRTRYGTLYDQPCSAWPQEARDYVLGDMAVRDLFNAQASVDPKYLVDEAAQVRAAVALRLMSAWGFTTDRERAEKFLVTVEEDLKKAEAVVVENGLARMSGGKLVKNKKAAEARIVAAYTAQGRDVPRGEPTEKMVDAGLHEGNIRLDKEACVLSDDPVLKAYTKFSQADTLRSKARRLLHSPIQCRYNVLVATGRTSCSQGDDPKPGEAWSAYGMQLQNLPRAEGVRECFVARPGHAIVSVDYDAFEMRTWAQVTKWVLGYSDLAEILNDPKRCPHVEMGAGLRGISVQAAYALKGDDKKALRGMAKGPNFGLPGGMGAARLMDYCRLGYGVELTMAQAQNACAVWRRVYREAQPYLDWISTLIGKRGSKATIEQFVSKRLRGRVGYCDAANGFFQGLAADIAKDAMWRVTEQAYEVKSSALYGCRPLAFIHDELLYEVPLDRLTEAGELMASIMTRTAMEWCPDVLFTASPAAQLHWSKAAGDPVRDANGALIPYEHRGHV
jgi:hypothetical protein